MRTARQRQGVTLFRPVFMNAVEVGYSYAHCDRDKKLNVRGVTIALWHFICRGHQAIALLPYCFKNYAEKSSRYSELMMLYRLNLIEFTPGYGSEKYAEVNRIMVNRAYETGGCLVARSQMQGITDNKTHLIDVVEQRLLMPTFNGDDIMFPIDGPLGRNGPSLKQTLECEQGSTDWRACSEHQLLLSDQRHWLEKLALLVPEKVAWTRMVQIIQAGGDMASASNEGLYVNEPPMIPSPPLAPLENPFNRNSTAPTCSNSSIVPPLVDDPLPPHSAVPISNSGNFAHHLPNPHQQYQIMNRHRHLTTGSGSPSRRFHHHHPHHQNQNDHQNRGRRHHSPTRLILRYGPTGNGNGSATYRSKHSATTDSVESTASTQSSGSAGIGGEAVNVCSGTDVDEDVARSLNAQLIEEARRDEEKRKQAEAAQKRKDELLAKLSQIFGYSKSVRVMAKFPSIQTFCLLVEKCIQEADVDGDEYEFADVWAEDDADDLRTAIEDTDIMDLQNRIETTDLIDFSDEQLVEPEHEEKGEEEGEKDEPIVDLMN
ncbi:unnamed protein product [Caenorhabditis sp. 36 PRJEB53466]|nr:unnamed protein product [Caenorhabditis sp. 36 PRJEB53466]